MNAILSVLLQLSADVRSDFAGAADADAAITEASTATAAAASNPFLPFMCPPWWVSISIDVENHALVGATANPSIRDGKSVRASPAHSVTS